MNFYPFLSPLLYAFITEKEGILTIFVFFLFVFHISALHGKEEAVKLMISRYKQIHKSSQKRNNNNNKELYLSVYSFQRLITNWEHCKLKLTIKSQMLVFEGRGNRSTRRKPLSAEQRTNKLNLHMTPDLGIEPGPQWRKASALTTASSLHPNNNM